MVNKENFNTDNVSYTEMTREFYRAFKQSIPDKNSRPSLAEDTIPEDRLHLKMNLIAEEFSELVEAVYGKEAAEVIRESYKKAVEKDDKNRDIVEAADATADLRVVLDGFDIETNIPTEKVFNEVFRSNMSKLDSDGNPILSDGTTAPLNKIMKSDNYFAPDIKSVLFSDK